MKKKRIYIKVLLFGVCSSFVLNLISCKKDVEPTTHFHYTYQNKTNYDMNIEHWIQGQKKVFDLDDASSIVFSLSLGVGSSHCSVNDSVVYDNHCMLYEADSLKVVFDDGKELLYVSVIHENHSDSSSFNLFTIENYLLTEEGNKIYYEYTFTEEDYKLAVHGN